MAEIPVGDASNPQDDSEEADYSVCRPFAKTAPAASFSPAAASPSRGARPRPRSATAACCRTVAPPAPAPGGSRRGKAREEPSGRKAVDGAAHWEASLQLAAGGPDPHFLDLARAFLEGAAGSSQRNPDAGIEEALEVAAQSPRFVEALSRQGLCLEELGPRSLLAPERRAALLAATLQERQLLVAMQPPPLRGSPALCLRMRQGLANHLDWMFAQEEHRRTVLQRHIDFIEARREGWQAEAAAQEERRRIHSMRLEAERARRTQQMQDRSQRLSECAAMARHGEWMRSMELAERFEEVARRRAAHMQSRNLQRKASRDRSRLQELEREHQVLRVARMKEDRNSRKTEQLEEDAAAFASCQWLLDDVKPLSDPAALTKKLQFLSDFFGEPSTVPAVGRAEVDAPRWGGLGEVDPGAQSSEEPHVQHLRHSLSEPSLLRESLSRGAGALGSKVSRMAREREAALRLDRSWQTVSTEASSGDSPAAWSPPT